MDPLKLSFLSGIPSAYLIALNAIRTVDPTAHFVDEKCSEPTFLVRAVTPGQKLGVFTKYFDALGAIHGSIFNEGGLTMRFSVMGVGVVTLMFKGAE